MTNAPTNNEAAGEETPTAENTPKKAPKKPKFVVVRQHDGNHRAHSVKDYEATCFHHPYYKSYEIIGEFQGKTEAETFAMEQNG